MKLLLARHGNTFGPTDQVIWVGAKNDLPLVDSGRTQARVLAAAIKRSGIELSAIYAAPLKRTLEYAEIVSAALNTRIPIVADARLTEIDYGTWTGLSSALIQAKYGSEDLDLWERKSIWPKGAAWRPSEEEVVSGIQSLCTDLISKSTPAAFPLIISSNGILRYFLKLNQLEWIRRLAEHNFKVKTGNICLLNLTKESVQVNFWDRTPDANMLQWEAQ